MRKYCSISWLTCSDSLSVCGWKAVESFCLIPSFLQSSCVTCATNCGPLSEIMASGNPVCFYMLSSSSWLVCSAMMVLLQGDKIIALLCRLTTVRILSFFFFFFFFGLDYHASQGAEPYVALQFVVCMYGTVMYVCLKLRVISLSHN